MYILYTGTTSVRRRARLRNARVNVVYNTREFETFDVYTEYYIILGIFVRIFHETDGVLIDRDAATVVENVENPKITARACANKGRFDRKST